MNKELNEEGLSLDGLVDKWREYSCEVIQHAVDSQRFRDDPDWVIKDIQKMLHYGEEIKSFAYKHKPDNN